MVKRRTGREGVGGVGLGSVTSNAFARIDRARVWINVGEPNVSPSNPAAFIPNSVGIENRLELVTRVSTAHSRACVG